jgi:hypothetical protein
MIGLAGLTAAGRRVRQMIALAEENLAEVLAARPRHAEALFTRFELLIFQHRFADAKRLVHNLPEYLSARPEFLALQGSLAWGELQENGPHEYLPSLAEAVVQPWSEAGRTHTALAAGVPVVQLRATTALYDGVELAAFRGEAVLQLDRLLGHEPGGDTPVRDPQRNTALRAWWLGSVEGIVGGFEEGASGSDPYAYIKPRLIDHADLLDTLERELIDAARFSSSPA